MNEPTKGTLKMRDMKMQDSGKCGTNLQAFAGGGKCETRKCGTKIQGWKMREWKMRHKAAKGGKCRNRTSGKRKIWKPYVK